jgi:hypothetical protein
MEVHILRKVEDPGTNVRRIAAAEGISFPLVWRILHEKSLHPHHIQQEQALVPPDHHARSVFCQWLLTKYIVNTKYAANILFTDEVRFTGDSIVNFHITHVVSQPYRPPRPVTEPALHPIPPGGYLR